MEMQPPAVVISPLDQLEAQVNLVLEHTGRVFAGSARSQKEHGAVNNPARLKLVLSGAIDNFHDALDVLEEELAVARAVMRRDLAVCRTASITQQSVARSSEQTANEASKEEAKPADDGAGDIQDMDFTMTGDSFKTIKESPPREAPFDGEPSADNAASDQALGQGADHQGPNQGALQIEIPSGEHQGDNQTDIATGTYSNFDFESLFNDPSAQASPDVVQMSEAPKEGAQATDEQTQPTSSAAAPATTTATTTTTAPTAPMAPMAPMASTTESQQKEPVPGSGVDTAMDLTADTNSNDQPEASQNDDLFDLGDLTNFGDDTDMNDNDNISSLLPGLESYANAPTDPSQAQNASDSFNIFDAAGAPDFGSADASAAPNDAKKEKDDSNADKNNDGTTSATTGQQNSNATDNKTEGEQNQNEAQTGNPEESGEQRDDTFDALMDFDNFDMGSFGADDGDNAGTAFDASFFDI